MLGGSHLNHRGDAADLGETESEKFSTDDERNGRRKDLAHAFKEGLEALANVLEGTASDEIDQEGDQNRNHNGCHQTEFDAVVDHRREDDQQEQGQNRQNGVVSGTGVGKGILGFAGNGARVILDALGSLTAVKPTLHQRVPHSHSNNDADGNRDLAGHEVRHNVGIDKVGSAHGVGRTRAQVQAAGRTDHGGGSGAANTQLNE